MTAFNAIAISHLPDGYTRFNFKSLARRYALDLYDPAFGVQLWEVCKTTRDRRDREIWGDWPICTGLRAREVSDELRRRATRLASPGNQDRLSLFFVLPETLLTAESLEDAQVLIDQCASIWRVLTKTGGISVGPADLHGRLAIYVVLPQIVSGVTSAGLAKLASDLVGKLNFAISTILDNKVPRKLVNRCLFLDQRALEDDDPDVVRMRFLALRTALAAVTTMEGAQDAGDVQTVFDNLKGRSAAAKPAMLRVSSTSDGGPFCLADTLHCALRRKIRPHSMSAERRASNDEASGNLDYLQDQFQKVIEMFKTPSTSVGVTDEVTRMIVEETANIVSESQKIDKSVILEPDLDREDSTETGTMSPADAGDGPAFGSKWYGEASRQEWHDPDVTKTLERLDTTFRSNISKTKDLLLRNQKQIRTKLRDKQREVRETVRADWESKTSEATGSTKEQIQANIAQVQHHRLAQEQSLLTAARAERIGLVKRFRLDRRRDAVDAEETDEFLQLSLAPDYVDALEGAKQAADNLSERGAGLLAVLLCAVPWFLYTAVLFFDSLSNNRTVAMHNIGIAVLLAGIALLTFVVASRQLAKRYKQAFKRLRDAARSIVNEIAGIPSGVRTFCARAEASAGFKETERLYQYSLEVGRALLQREAFNQLGAERRDIDIAAHLDYTRVAQAGPLGRDADSHDPHELIVETLRRASDVAVPDGSITVLFKEEGGFSSNLSSATVYEAVLEVEWAS